MRIIFAKFSLVSKIQTLFHKLLVRQISNHHHCNWHDQKTYIQGFSSNFEQFFLVKNNFICVNSGGSFCYPRYTGAIPATCAGPG